MSQVGPREIIIPRSVLIWSELNFLLPTSLVRIVCVYIDNPIFQGIDKITLNPSDIKTIYLLKAEDQIGNNNFQYLKSKLGDELTNNSRWLADDDYIFNMLNGDEIEIPTFTQLSLPYSENAHLYSNIVDYGYVNHIEAISRISNHEWIIMVKKAICDAMRAGALAYWHMSFIRIVPGWSALCDKEIIDIFWGSDYYSLITSDLVIDDRSMYQFFKPLTEDYISCPLIFLKEKILLDQEERNKII